MTSYITFTTYATHTVPWLRSNAMVHMYVMLCAVEMLMYCIMLSMPKPMTHFITWLFWYDTESHTTVCSALCTRGNARSILNVEKVCLLSLICAFHLIFLSYFLSYCVFLSLYEHYYYVTIVSLFSNDVLLVRCII